MTASPFPPRNGSIRPRSIWTGVSCLAIVLAACEGTPTAPAVTGPGTPPDS